MPSPNPMTRREHRGSASPATLTASMSPSDTAFSISTNTGWPTGSPGPFFVVIDPGTGSEEKVLCAAQSTSVVTVAGGGRGVDGTIAKAHAIGAVVYPVWTAQEADEANEHLASNAGVHGVSAVVGASDTQTLTNKTISTANNTIVGLQPADATLTALAGLNATGGLVAQTAADTFTKRTLISSDTALVVTNGDGVAGNPSLAITEANLTGIPEAAVTGLSTKLTTLEIGVTRHVFTASGSLAAATVAGAKKLLIQGVGGGGAGGGAAATAAGQYSYGSGGQGGTYGEILLTVSALTFPLQLTIGAGGAGVSGAAGGAGGLTRVRDNNGAGAVLFEVNGGAGGDAAPAAATPINVAGGDAPASGTAEFLIVGESGWGAWQDTANFPHPGPGGVSHLGHRTGGLQMLPGNVAGGAGALYGGGGGGSARRASQTALAGGAGAAGLLIITAIY